MQKTIALCLAVLAGPFIFMDTASAATSIQVDRKDVVRTVDQCTGIPSVITFEYHAVYHESQDGTGRWHVHFANTGDITIEPEDDQQGAIYQGHFNESLNFTISSPDRTQLFSFVFRAQMKGSDGTRRLDNGSAQVTVRPDGTLAVEFGSFVCN